MKMTLTLWKEFDVNIKRIDDSIIESFVLEYPCTWILSTLAWYMDNNDNLNMKNSV